MTDTINFSMPSRTLKALAITAAKKDVRYYLCGVAFDFTGTYPVAVSTDGHRALVIKLYVDTETLPSNGSLFREQAVIVPLDAIASVKARKGSDVSVTLTAGNPSTFSIENGTTISGNMIDGRFPEEWRRIVPESASGETAQYQANYVGDFSKIATMLDARYPTIAHNGNSPALVHITSDAFGVLMPFRGDPVTDKPEWI